MRGREPPVEGRPADVAAIEAYAILALLVVLLVVVVLLSLHFLRRYRLQRLHRMREEDSGPARASDRAYNRLALARKEADVLQAQGGDVDRARQLIDLANRALDHREFDRAYELAQSAHETLVKSRRDPRPSRPGAPAAPDPLLPLAAAPPAPVAPGPRSAGAPPLASSSPLAKSRVEAQFELRLFEEELARATQQGGTAAALTEARGLYVQAHAAFARSEYLEAFRLSLRGRRRVGAHVESLGAPATAAPSAVPQTDAADSAEAVAGEARCPQCGHPTVPGDAFCRGCGAARAPPSCPKCGSPRLPTDTFCGRCGERYPAATA